MQLRLPPSITLSCTWEGTWTHKHQRCLCSYSSGWSGSFLIQMHRDFNSSRVVHKAPLEQQHYCRYECDLGTCSCMIGQEFFFYEPFQMHSMWYSIDPNWSHSVWSLRTSRSLPPKLQFSILLAWQPIILKWKKNNTRTHITKRFFYKIREPSLICFQNSAHFMIRQCKVAFMSSFYSNLLIGNSIYLYRKWESKNETSVISVMSTVPKMSKPHFLFQVFPVILVVLSSGQSLNSNTNSCYVSCPAGKLYEGTACIGDILYNYIW